MILICHQNQWLAACMDCILLEIFIYVYKINFNFRRRHHLRKLEYQRKFPELRYMGGKCMLNFNVY